MKIEVGESLALSWLRHTRGCQLAQINWKASPDMLTEAAIQPIRPLFESIRAAFDQADVPLPLIKQTASLHQWLKQGEVDALGLKLSDGGVEAAIAVDIAFHEGGLRYGSSTETAARVAKKLLRTALLLHGPLGLTGGYVVFASPKASPSTRSAVLAALDRVRVFAQGSTALDTFKFDVFVGEDFNRELLQPVLASSKHVADTSELFLRSVQLIDLFE